ncbi:hypothetical protein [Natronorarus salvus]|uniref:hypothetical protein n=1 Tax=Natronorarus salvus TaxID=3117733 RepID=UPI002F264675
MFRAILPDGAIECAAYDLGDQGVELRTEEDELIAFVPYANLVALVNEELESNEDRAIF